MIEQVMMAMFLGLMIFMMWSFNRESSGLLKLIEILRERHDILDQRLKVLLTNIENHASWMKIVREEIDKINKDSYSVKADVKKVSDDVRVLDVKQMSLRASSASKTITLNISNPIPFEVVKSTKQRHTNKENQ